MSPPLIALEEHFFSTSLGDGLNETYAMQIKHIPELTRKLRDLDHSRLMDMASGRISVQVISHAPGALSKIQAEEANNQLAEAVQKHPDKFAGFAALPMADAAASAAELRRCVLQLKFKGALVDSHSEDGKYYDCKEYDQVWEVATTLDVPIYLHPTWPTDPQMQAQYQGEFPEAAGQSISTSAFGWHSDTAVHFLRLYASGLFDRYPTAKIILGHFGEMLPFMLERICVLSERWGKFRRPFRQVWDENVWITTSGVWSLAPMEALLRNTRPEKILYSVDYPFTTNERGLHWWNELEQSQLLSPEDLGKIAHGNAEKLLSIKALTVEDWPE